MKNKMWKRIPVLIAVGIFALLTASPSKALETKTFGDGQEFTVYGWIRNNMGMFTDKIDYRQDGNDLATARTWIRTYFEYKYSSHLNMWAAVQFAWEPWYPIEKGAVSSNPHYTDEPVQHGGREYSEYRDINDVLRELWINWQPVENHNFRIGRQILIWGEALTTRVGDVIHADNTRYTFAFANLEDTRIPMWMVRGTHFFENILGGTEFEWLVAPNFEREEWRVNQGGNFAVPAIGEAGQRFAVYPEDRFWPAIPTTAFMRDAVLGQTGIPDVHTEYPDQSSDDLRYGARLNMFLGGAYISFMYYHTQTYSPSVKFGGFTPFGPPGTPVGLREYTLIYPEIDIYGISMNKQLSRGVLRAEAIWIPEQPFGTFDLTDADAITEKDLIKYMVAWDVKFFPKWHKTASIDVTLEHVADWVPDADENTQFGLWGERQNSYDPGINMRITTDWQWSKYNTSVIFGYYPKIRGGLFMPSVTYRPIWLNNAFTFELKYIRVFADTNYYGIGVLQQKDMVLLTTQYNF